MSNLIDIRNVSKDYGRNNVLNDVDLQLTKGKIIGLCGPNGAGKTTLIKILVGLLKDYKGEILIDNEKIGIHSKAIISYLPDLNYFENTINGNKAMNLYIDMYSDFDKSIYMNLMSSMHLDMKLPLKKMSKGMKEKFQLALALARQADIYLLDEPIAGVDPASRDLIIETILANYNENALMIISTHLISDVEPILDEVIFLNEGRVTLHENCDELRERTNMSVNELFREEFRWS